MKHSGTKVASDALFDKCVQTVLRNDGTMLICCKLGLWSCSGRDHEQVKHEARHYFSLYHADGEYDEMLSNDKAHFSEVSDNERRIK